jgi:hypothetical protein
MNSKETIQAFRESGLGYKAFGSIEAAYKWLHSQKQESTPCNYDGIPRNVSPETCEYHTGVKDPKCQRCPRAEFDHYHACKLREIEQNMIPLQRGRKSGAS